MGIRSLKQANINGIKTSKAWDQLETSKPSISVEVLLIGGGGSGGVVRGGGGGAGGVYNATVNFVLGTTYTITVGAGAAKGTTSYATPKRGLNGNRSRINGGELDISAYGGGAGGGGFTALEEIGFSGGSGGGAAMVWIGSALTSIVGKAIESQGNDGGNVYTPGEGYNGGGGGGAGAAGSDGVAGGGGAGGNGTSSYSTWGSATTSGQNISGTYWFAGGGAGGSYNTGTGSKATGGNGGGGNGGNRETGASGAPTAGTANTGGGGGGGGNDDSGQTRPGETGGSGIVLIRYADTIAAATSTTGSPSTVTSGGYRYYKFTGDGSITI